MLIKSKYEETKIKCHKDEKFIKSTTQIITKIEKIGEKIEKKFQANLLKV